MLKPIMVRTPSRNFFEPGEMWKSTIAAVCLHGTASAGIQPALDWLRNPRLDNPNAAVSANYAISKLGTIYELVPWEQGLRAYANGVVDLPDQSLGWLMEAIRLKINPNWITVSIEHEATQYEMEHQAPMTDAQFTSSIELTAYILATAGLKANHQTVIGHFQINGRQKRNCPGVINPGAYTEQLIKRHPELG